VKKIMPLANATNGKRCSLAKTFSSMVSLSKRR
jgi:hypothetical protein